MYLTQCTVWTWNSGEADHVVQTVVRPALSDGNIRPGGCFNLLRITRDIASEDSKQTEITNHSSKLTEPDNDDASGMSEAMSVTDIHLLSYGSGQSLSARDEENLQDDLLRVLVTHLSQNRAIADQDIDLEVEFAISQDQPGLWIVGKDRRPTTVLGYPYEFDRGNKNEAMPAFGTRDMGGVEGGLYDAGNSHVVIQELRGQPGTSVLVLLSPPPRCIMAIEGATVSALEAIKNYDCCRVTCVRCLKRGHARYRLRFYNRADNGALDSLVLSEESILREREDSHSQSLRLFEGIPSERADVYVVLSDIATTPSKAESEESSLCLVPGAPNSIFYVSSQCDGIVDPRLQGDVWNVWNTFWTACQWQLRKVPNLSHYVVQQYLQFTATYKAGAKFFSVKYTGPELLEKPFTMGDESHDSYAGKKFGGQGLMGKLTKLTDSGTRLRVRVWSMGPIHSNPYDRHGEPLPGFWWPTQFCDVTRLRVEGTTTHYSLTFIHTPITESHQMEMDE